MAARKKPLNLTEIFLDVTEHKESMAWQAAKATGNGLLWAGKATAIVGMIAGIIALAIASGGAGVSSLPDFSGSDEPRHKKRKTTDDDGNKKTVEVIEQRLQLKPEQIILAESVDPKSEFGKVGAKTFIHSDDGLTHHIKQPIAYLQKLGCDI